jgi:hypothetical protein
MKLNNTRIVYATEEAREQFEGKNLKEEKTNDCVSCEIEPIKEKTKKEIKE